MAPDLSYLRNLDPKRSEPRSGRPNLKAVVTTGNGGTEELEVRNVAVPEPAPGAGVDRIVVRGSDLVADLGESSVDVALIPEEDRADGRP